MRPVGPTALLRQGRNTVLGWRREHRVSTIVEKDMVESSGQGIY
jgi:hypothetical protein